MSTTFAPVVEQIDRDRAVLKAEKAEAGLGRLRLRRDDLGLRSAGGGVAVLP